MDRPTLVYRPHSNDPFEQNAPWPAPIDPVLAQGEEFHADEFSPLGKLATWLISAAIGIGVWWLLIWGAVEGYRYVGR